MSDMELVNGAATRIEARLSILRDSMLLTLLLYTLVRSGEALAGNAAGGLNTRAPSTPAASTLTDPALSAREFAAAAPFSVKQFSPTEFRPRPQTQLESEAARGSFGMDEHLIGSSSVSEQLEQFRTQDRVRLLTLWQTRASSVSLQADKHGGPSLQWSSPWMVRGSSSHGLLDNLFNVPSRGVASRIGAARAASAPSPPKPAEATAGSKTN